MVLFTNTTFGKEGSSLFANTLQNWMGKLTFTYAAAVGLWGTEPWCASVSVLSHLSL